MAAAGRKSLSPGEWAANWTGQALAMDSHQAWGAKSFTWARGRSGSAAKPKLLGSVQPSGLALDRCVRPVEQP